MQAKEGLLPPIFAEPNFTAGDPPPEDTVTDDVGVAEGYPKWWALEQSPAGVAKALTNEPPAQRQRTNAPTEGEPGFEEFVDALEALQTLEFEGGVRPQLEARIEAGAEASTSASAGMATDVGAGTSAGVGVAAGLLGGRIPTGGLQGAGVVEPRVTLWTMESILKKLEGYRQLYHDTRSLADAALQRADDIGRL